MPNLSSLTRGERAVLHEIERQFSGCALISYSWLKTCVIRESRAIRPGYPENERTLNRSVNQLVKRGFVVRLRTQDRGTFHGLVETWNRLPGEIRSEIVEKDMMARGSKTEVAMLVFGPAALPTDLREKVWQPSGPAEPGVAFEFRGLKLGEGRHEVDVGPLPQTIPAGEYRVASNVRLVNLVFRGQNDT
jgi:hypothetical protein